MKKIDFIKTKKQLPFEKGHIETAGRSKPKKLPYRKPDGIKELESKVYESHYKNSPLPHQYRSKFHFRDDTANGLTKCIIAYLKLKGAFVTRLNTTGMYRADLKRHVPNTQKKGMGDIFATYKGVSIQVEVKTGRDRMNATQQRTKAEFEQSGGYYFIAKNFESFKQWFDSFIQRKIQPNNE